MRALVPTHPASLVVRRKKLITNAKYVEGGRGIEFRHKLLGLLLQSPEVLLNLGEVPLPLEGEDGVDGDGVFGDVPVLFSCHDDGYEWVR